MTKKRKIESSSERDPEAVDPEQMSPQMRDFAAALSNLKAYCFDNGVDWEETTAWYEEWMRHPSHVNENILAGISATRAHVEFVIASRGPTDPFWTDPPWARGDTEAVALLGAEVGKVVDGSKRVETFFATMQAMGFPKERAGEILNDCLATLPVEEAVQRAEQQVADEMRVKLASLEEDSDKMTIGVGTDGVARLMPKWMAESNNERIRRLMRNFGGSA